MMENERSGRIWVIILKIQSTWLADELDMELEKRKKLRLSSLSSFSIWEAQNRVLESWWSGLVGETVIWESRSQNKTSRTQELTNSLIQQLPCQ